MAGGNVGQEERNGIMQVWNTIWNEGNRMDERILE